MKLITELNEDVQNITEVTESGKKNFYIEGIFLQSAIKNRNGRIYPEGIMDKEVARYIKETVDQNRAYGELNHPTDPSIHLDRVSHIITSLKKDGTNYIGKARIGETDCGKTAKAIIEMGGKLGVSSRGLGTLKVNKQGINEVQSDFKLATAADIVADPSAPSAFVNGIYEGYEFMFDGTKIEEPRMKIYNHTKELIERAIRSRVLEQEKYKIFEQFMNNLSNLSK